MYDNGGQAQEHQSHEHQHHGHHHPHQQTEAQSEVAEPPKHFGINNKILFAVFVIAILAVTLYIRLGLTGSQGLFEPDGFFYYSIVRATLNSHLSEPQYLGISGFPTHNFIGEAPGLPYMTVIFYLLLSWTGVTSLQVMRLLPVFVAIIEVILAYFIAKELSNSRLCGLLAMFFVAVSAGNVARTAALVYRGDTFIGIPIMLAILLLIKGLKMKSTKLMIVVALFSAFVLSTGMLVWNGSPYIIVVYMLSLALMAFYAFISWKPELMKPVFIFICALFILFPLQSAYIYLHGARTGLALGGISFLAFYIPLLIGAALSFFLIRKGRTGIFMTTLGRIAAAIVVTIVLLGIVVAAFGGYVNTIAQASGVSAPTSTSQQAGINYAVGATTQELQKPTFSFLYASFSLALYLAPIGVLLFLLLNKRLDGREEESKAFITPTFIVLLAYLLVTAYLQYNAIRYNSLLSIPLALLSAYALYAIIESSAFKLEGAKKYLFAVGAIIVVGLLAIFWLHNLFNAGFALNNTIYIMEAIISIVLLAAILGYSIVPLLRGSGIDLRMVCVLSALIIMLFCFSLTAVESYSSSQADGINPTFLSAMSWMKANTPVNATVLALWPDGSVVEGWANRTSYMDSVGGENATRIYYFARYLTNSSPDTQYLYGIGKPQYLISRQYWLSELTGLVAEGEPSNPDNYTFAALGLAGTPQQNATAQVYTFTDNVTMIATKASNGTLTNYRAYIGPVGALQDQDGLSRVTLYDTASTFYQEYNTTNANYKDTLMIFYTGNSLEGAIVMPDTLYRSNLFKLVWLCGWYECPLSNSSASITPVFINNDTRIFKITYT